MTPSEVVSRSTPVSHAIYRCRDYLEDHQRRSAGVKQSHLCSRKSVKARHQEETDGWRRAGSARNRSSLFREATAGPSEWAVASYVSFNFWI